MQVRIMRICRVSRFVTCKASESESRTISKTGYDKQAGNLLLGKLHANVATTTSIARCVAYIVSMLEPWEERRSYHTTEAAGWCSRLQ